MQWGETLMLLGVSCVCACASRADDAQRAPPLPPAYPPLPPGYPPLTTSPPAASPAPAAPAAQKSLVPPHVDRSRFLSIRTLGDVDKRQMGRCAADAGCARAPAKVPPCPVGLEPVSTDEIVARVNGESGVEVLVKGPLGAGHVIITGGACSGGCCDEGSFRRKVGPFDIGAYCSFDTSAHACCTFSGPESVVAIGRLVREGSNGPWQLVNALMCNPDESPDAVAPSSQPPPAGIGFAEWGCFVGERRVPPYETYERDGWRCGCFDGEVFCQPDSQKCFDRGQWFDPGAVVTAKNEKDVSCTCKEGAWSCGYANPPLEWSIEFYLDGIKSAGLRKIADVGDLRHRHTYEFELTGQANDADGKQARALAMRRAREVERTLLGVGVRREQMRIAAPGVDKAFTGQRWVGIKFLRGAR